ncbi:MAG: hypothetical protein H7202_02005, partial [Pedobacter sp.]|nr:hypothetical protein [Pedobacter sp.]
MLPQQVEFHYLHEPNILSCVKSAIKNLFLFILMVCFLPSATKAQDPIGVPQVTSYRGLDYGAGTQNWGIAQDHNGIMYIANN